MFTELLKTHKKDIISSLHDVLTYQKSNSINAWGIDAITRLETFCSSGKMLRGSLVFMGYAITGKEVHTDVIKIATAMELFQAGFLIHDDIMDGDSLRRGNASMHIQYANLFSQHAMPNHKIEGINFSICIGDLAFFYAYELLESVKNNRILRYTSRILSHTVQAQMQDVYFASAHKDPSIDDILSLYHHKTGEYSITLPMVLGAILGNASDNTIHHLELFGKHMGIAYQLIDDRLNLFGNTRTTKKSTGSDIINGKKTLYYSLISQSQIGKALMETKDISKIKTYCIETGIDDKIAKYTKQHISDAKEALFHIPLPDTMQDMMTECMTYLINRTS